MEVGDAAAGDGKRAGVDLAAHHRRVPTVVW